MEDQHKQILQRNRVLFRRELSAEKIAIELFSANILDQEDLHEVKGATTPEKRADTLLDLLPRKGPEAFPLFYKSLQKSRQDLADKILTPFSELNLEHNNAFGQAGLPCLPNNFTGRADLRSEICSKIEEGYKLLPVVAPPGYGKSCLTVVVGHKLKQDGYLVLYFELKGKTTVFSACVLILETLGRVPSNDPAKQLQQFLRTQERNSQESKTVLILDNTEDLQVKENEQFLNFLEEVGKFTENVSTIVTTTQAFGRLQLVSFPAKSFPLQPLGEDDAQKLWMKLNPAWTDERSFSLRQLCDRCMGIPLFLEVAASQVMQGADIISLIEDLESSPEVLLQEEKISLKMKVFLSRIPDDLKITLAKLAVFPAHFSYNEMKFLFNVSGLELRQKLAKLIDYSLVKFDKETATYKLHSVVQSAVSKARFDGALYQEFNAAVVQFVEYYMKLLQEMNEQFISHNNMKALEHYAQQKRNILHAFSLAIEYKLALAVDVSTEVVNLLAKCMNIKEFEKVYLGMGDLVKEDIKRYSDCLTSLGFKYLCYHGRQNNLQARQFLTEACKLQELCQSIDTEERAHALSKLGLCLALSIEKELGMRMIAKGIVIRKNLFRRDGGNIRQMLVAGGYCDLAMAISKYNSKVAVKIWRQTCLATYQETLNTHPFTATLSQYIGEAYHKQGQYQQAEEFKQCSLEMRKSLLTEYHQDTARSYSSLAETLEALGKIEQAVEMLEKTRHIQARVSASPEDLMSTEKKIGLMKVQIARGVGR